MQNILVRVSDGAKKRPFDEEVTDFKQLHFLFSPEQCVRPPFPDIQAATIDAYVNSIVKCSHVNSGQIDDFLFGVGGDQVEDVLQRVSASAAHDSDDKATQLAIGRLKERFDELYGVHARGYPRYRCRLAPAEPPSNDPSTLATQLEALVGGGHLANLVPSDIIAHSDAVAQLLLVRRRIVSWILLELVTPKSSDMRDRAMKRWYSVALKLRGTCVYGCVREALSHQVLSQIISTSLPPLPGCALGESFSDVLLDLTKFDILSPDTMGERHLQNFRKTGAIGRIARLFYQTLRRAYSEAPLDLCALPPMLTTGELYFLAASTLGRHPLAEKPSVVSKLFDFLKGGAADNNVSFSPSELFTVNVKAVFEDSQDGFRYQRGAPIVSANSVNNFLWIVEEGEIGVHNAQKELVGRPLRQGNIFGCLAMYHLDQIERQTEFPIIALSSIVSLRRVERSRVFHTFRHDAATACSFYKCVLQVVATRVLGLPLVSDFPRRREAADLFQLFDGVVGRDEAPTCSFAAKYAVSPELTLYGTLYITPLHACFVSFTFKSRYRFAVALRTLGKFGDFSDTSGSLVIGDHRVELVTESDTELAEQALVEALRESIADEQSDTLATLQSDAVIVDHEWHLLMRSIRERKLEPNEVLLAKGSYSTHMYCVVMGSLHGDDLGPIDGLFGSQLYFAAQTCPCDVRADAVEGATVLQVSLAHMEIICQAKPSFGSRLYEWIGSQLFATLAISTRSALDSAVSSKTVTRI